MGSRKELCATVSPATVPPAEVAATLAERVAWDVGRIVEAFPVERYAERSYEAGRHGWGTLYRWRDRSGRYDVVDRFQGAEGEYGEDVLAHFRSRHGVDGHAFRRWELEAA